LAVKRKEQRENVALSTEVDKAMCRNDRFHTLYLFFYRYGIKKNDDAIITGI